MKLTIIAATLALSALGAQAQTVITLDATTVAPPNSSPCVSQPPMSGVAVLTCALTVEAPVQPPVLYTYTAPGSIQYAVGALINGVQYTSLPWPAGQPPFYNGVTQYAMQTADGSSSAILDMAMRIWSSGGGRGSGSHVQYYPGAGTITTYP